MSDYLSQLAIRIQQPEFAIQPRPVSRFESQRHSIPTAHEPFAPEEADELGSQSAVFIPAETNAARRTQPADSRIRREPDTSDSLSEVQSTRKYQNLYPEHSTTAPAIVTPPRSTDTANLPVLEVAHPAPRGQQADQRESSVRSAVAQAQPSARIDRLEQQTNKDSPNPLGRRERSEFTDLVARREGERGRPIVRIENPKGEGAAFLSTRALNHKGIGTFSEPTETEPLFGRKAELTAKSGFAPVPGREDPQPRGEPADPQFVTNRATDAPTIHVTIGRVEIRATVASAPTTRKAPTHTPVMSLEEYLKQRNGSRG